MSVALRPMAEPIRAVVDRAHWAQAARACWPTAPDWMITQIVGVLSIPSAEADTLLIVADALDQARAEANISGYVFVAHGLDRLAILLRQEAPNRIPPI